MPAMIDPELKGKLIWFTKNNSKALKYLSTLGNINLNINRSTATETTLAMIKFLTVISRNSSDISKCLSRNSSSCGK